MESNETEFKKMAEIVMKSYHDCMHNYLTSNELGKLTDADVILMVMNMTIGIGVNIYYSLKQFLPSSPVDYDFIKAKLINSFVDDFEKIKQYNPKTEMLSLTEDQIKTIARDGSVVVKMPDGTDKEITKEDILIKKEDVHKILNMNKKDIIDTSSDKIILPKDGSFKK